MEDVGTLVEDLETRGVVFSLDPACVRFAYDWRSLEAGDPAKLGELILEREDETRAFLERRGRPSNFGAYAGVFRSFTCRFHAPAGMVPWLRERAPRLYADLTGRLPDRICELWQQNAPMEEFERAVGRLEESHRTALGFYLACQGGTNGSQE